MNPLEGKTVPVTGTPPGIVRAAAIGAALHGGLLDGMYVNPQ